MKRKHLIFTILVALSIALVGCSMLNPEEEVLERPAAVSGEADFSVYVSLGNSLTAGYQSGALYESAQLYSYPARLAVAMGTGFEMPLIDDPGYYLVKNPIGDPLGGGSLPVGHLEIVYEDGEAGLAVIPWNDAPPGFPNADLARPYNNLGIPGAVTWDLLNATDAAYCASGNNPHFDWILRNGQGFWSGNDTLTVVEQAIAQSPTFMTVWIGNNEILGAATEGSGEALVPTPVFEALYGGLMATLRGHLPETEVVVANIPSVTSTPYFTTVPWMVLGADMLPVDSNPTTPELDLVGLLTIAGEDTIPMTGEGLVLLPILSYDGDDSDSVPDLEQGLGIPDWLLIGMIMASQGVDQATAASLLDTVFPHLPHHGKPIPDQLTLVASERESIELSTAAFNSIIADSSAAYGYAMADMNSFFNTIAEDGIDYQGTHYTADFPTGGLFSLDGIHPSNVGQAVLTDKFIEVINETWEAELTAPGLPEIPLTREQRDVKLSFYPPGFPNMP